MMYESQSRKLKSNPNAKIFIDKNIFHQTKEVIETRAEARAIALEYGDIESFTPSDEYIGLVIQYPDSHGSVYDPSDKIKEAKDKGILVTVIADILSLTLLTPPGEMGAEYSYR
ncbi:MAG: hypothetical protein R2771_03745 [Saprospiraceae bacterium]